MFKKLKEKITEEVKISPQRFQQLTQTVSDKLQNVSASEENFFSIGDDDTNITSNTGTEAGFTSVSLMSPQENYVRRNSSSSIASDVSFLPRYESYANMYHLQSDLEISASEIEDNASSSSQLEHLSKQQIYAAFQKSQMRYHKYRGRYTDLAKHYKDLERENVKMKSVLVESQDKAIRRVTELKEQCSLEQKAKAHLESALRDEIDEKQLKIESLQTKIGLLQNGCNSKDDAENLDSLNKYLTEARLEIEKLNEKIQENKANSIIFQSKEHEYKQKISSLESEILLFTEREKENNLTLAQNKMELHNELLSKDNEISHLKQENESLRKNVDTFKNGNGKLDNLQTQNKKLIEKLENFTQKCNGYENELLKMEQYKIELQNSNQANIELKEKIKDLEEQVQTIREDAKCSLLSLETKIENKVSNEYAEKQKSIEEEYLKKLEEMSPIVNSSKQLQLHLLEKEKQMKSVQEENKKLFDDFTEKVAKYNSLETNHLELIQDCVGLRSKITILEKDISVMQDEAQSSKIKMKRLETECAISEKSTEDYQELKIKLQDIQKENTDLMETLAENRENIQTKNELATLEVEITSLKQDNKDLNEKLEKEQRKYAEEAATNRNLKSELDNLLTKSGEILNQIEVKTQKITQRLSENENVMLKLEKYKFLSLLQKLEKLQKDNGELYITEKKLKNCVIEKDQLFEKSIKTKQEVEETLKTLNEKNDHLQSKIEEMDQINKTLNITISSLESEQLNLTNKIEFAHQTNSKLESTTNLMNDTNIMNSKLKDELNNLKKVLDKRSDQVHQLENTNEVLQNNLISVELELTATKELLEKTNVELTITKNEILKNQQFVKDQECLNSEQLDNHEKERQRYLKENHALKDLLEESTNKLKERENEIKDFETKYIDSTENVKELSYKIENYIKNENELYAKIKIQEEMLIQLNAQIVGCMKQLETYNNLIVGGNEDVITIINRLSDEVVNDFKTTKDHQNLHNSEVRMQNLEQNFLVHKENRSKIVHCLKQFAEEYSILCDKKKVLENEKEELSNQIAGLKKEILLLKASDTDVIRLQEELLDFKESNMKLEDTNNKSLQNLNELESRNKKIISDNNFLSEENNVLTTDIEECKLKIDEIQKELKNAESTIQSLKTNILTLENQGILEKDMNFNELQEQLHNLQNEKHLLLEEVEKLKISPVQLNDLQNKEQNYLKQIENLKTKVVQYKSLDLTNKSSIEFYENELQKLKNLNEKLSRKLDETLVTLNHCSELSNSTEIEYLRNVLFNYMLGKESLILARVIAAVCKFDPEQTELVLNKEQQKQTLLGQLGIL